MCEAAQGNVPLELKRRIEGVLENFSGTQQLRTIRVVQVLDQIGTAGARDILRRMSAGVPEAMLTREATAALERLAAREKRGEAP